MTNERALLERAAQKVPVPDRIMEGLERRRERKRRRRQIGAALLAIVVAVFVVGGALRALRFASDRPTAGDSGTTATPAPPDPFLGVWTSTDTDGSRQTLWIHRGESGDSYDVRLYDRKASASCEGNPATVRGVGVVAGTGVSVPWSTLRCNGGTKVTDLPTFVFTYDSASDRMADSEGVTWHRKTGP